MNVNNRKGLIFDPGLCRCCGSMKKCRVLNAEYQFSGQKEVYSDMIMDCFGLLLSHLDGKTSERLVCATCVIRLREAFSFRRQVLQCEEAFLQMKVYDTGNPECVTQMEAALVDGAPHIGNHVKTEPSDREHGASDSDVCEDALAGTPEHVTRVEATPLKMQLVKTEPFDREHGASDTDACDALADAQEDAVKAELLNEDSNSTDDVPLQRVATRISQGRLPPRRVAWTNGSRPLVRTPARPKLPISKMQQIIRERDATYMIDTNIITIVENSYVCPFKCRHNHLLCYYCGENFGDPILLREHTANAHHPKRFKVSDHKNMTKIDLTRIDCRLCPIKIDNLEEFKRHVVQVHKKKFYFDYKDSVLPFILNKDEIKCAICHVIFPYFHALNKHMNEHFSNYVCETCGLGFVDRSRFVMHQARHEEGDFPCETCGKVFKAEYNRDLHIDRVHKKRGRVYCPKCDVKLMSYPQKLKHLVEVHGEQPLSFPCSVCDRVFDTRRTLTIHWRKDHLKDFRYECQICGQKFFTRFALNNHMPTHTGERNFKCKVCEKCYPRLKTLKDHMRIHTNDRRYRCHICGQAFIQNCSLKGHMKSQHPEYG